MKSKTKKRLIALGAVVVLAAGGAIGLRQLRASQRQQLVDDSRERGMAAYERGDWQQAMDSLGFYVSKGGRRDAEALYRLADARHRVPTPTGSHITDSISLLRDALAADPNLAEARSLLLDMYTAASMWPEAIEVVNRMLADDRQDRELLERRVYLLGAAGRDQEAARASAALVEAHPRDAGAHRLRLLLIGQTSQNSASELRAYVEDLGRTLGPGIDAEVLRGEVLGGLGDLDGAIAALDRASQVESASARQLSDMLDLADSLARVKPGEVRGIIDRVLGAHMAPESADVAGVLIARSWRMGREPEIERLLGQWLGQASALPDEALGWSVVAGTRLGAERRSALRDELASRSTPLARFFAAAAETVLALESRGEGVLESAARASQSAAQLPMRMHHARALAMYVSGWARSMASGPGAGDEALNQASYFPAWWIARRDYAQQLLARGEHQTVLAVLAGDLGFRQTGTGGLLEAEARVGLAERWPGDPESGRYAAAVLQELRRVGVSGAEADALLARALASSGGTGVGEAVDTLIANPGASVDLLTRTAGALSVRVPEQGQRLLEAASQREPGHPDVLFQRALSSAREGKVGEGLALLRAGAAEGAPAHRVRVQARLLRFLELTGDQAGQTSLDAARALASHADSLEAQLAVLGSDSAWREEDLVKVAIARVRALAGDGSSEWRLFEARRLLTFSPTPQRASEALSPTLEPLLRDGRSAGALTLAAEAWRVLGNREQTITQLERAVGASTDPTVVFPRLITALYEAGRVEDAQTRLRAFASIGQIGQSAGRARAALLEQFVMWDEALAERRRLAESGQESDAAALAALLARVGRLDEARRAFEALAERPDVSPASLAGAARFFAETGEVERGRALLDRLPESMSPVDRALTIGEYLRRHVGLDAAREHVIAAAERAGGEGGAAWVWLARAEIEGGQHDRARETIRRGLSVSPDSPALLAMQRFEGQGDRSDAMLGALASLSADNPGSVWLRETSDAVSAFAAGAIDAPTFATRLERIAASNPTAARVWGALAQLRLMLGQPDAAVVAATQGMRLSPGDALAARLAAELLESLGRHDQALEAARQWRERSPSDPMAADITIARLHLRRGRPADAAAILRDWREAILSTESPDVSHAAALAWSAAVNGPQADRDQIIAKAAQGGLWATACVAVGEAIQDAPTARAWLSRVQDTATLSSDDAIGLAAAWVALFDRGGEVGDVERALSALGDRQWTASQRGSASRLRGHALASLGRPAEAAEAYRLALQADAGDRGTMSALAEMLLETGESRQALDIAGRLAQAVIGDAAAPTVQVVAASDLLARCHMAVDDRASAVRALDDGLRRAPRDATLLGRKAEALLFGGDQAGAAAALGQVRSEDSPATIMLVLASRLTDRPEQVEWLYRRALEREHGNVLALNNLAYHLLTHRTGESGMEAVALARRAVDNAVARDPSWTGLGSIHETLGLAYLANGQAAEAEAAFTQGLRWTPTDPDLLLGLAEAQERRGARDQARRTLERIGAGVRAGLSSEQQVRYERLATVLDR